jgi:hypothetical protein
MTDKIRRRRRRPRNAGPSGAKSNTAADTQYDGTYSVGYGKPPRNTQFQPGQSGNPRGRPRGSKNLATLIEQELSATVAVNEGGRRRTLSKRAVIAKRLVNKAAEGDFRTVQTLFKVQESALAGPDPVESNEEEENLGPDDQAILQAYESKLIQRLGQPGENAKQTPKPTRKRRKK